MRTINIVLILTIAIACEAASPTLRFAWKQITYAWDNPTAREIAVQSGKYKPSNNIILGLAKWKDKLFITAPRSKSGVASSLNYINVTGAQDQALIPYPSWKDNLMADDAKKLPSNSSIVSPFRVYVDSCDRLWVMDSGLADILGVGNQIVGPSLVVFDLNTDKLLHRYFFKDSEVKENSLFVNVVVDVDKNTCDDAFVYVPDSVAYGVVVYSLKKDDSWRITHQYFHSEPLHRFFNVGGVEFKWSDGVFSLALSEPMENGYRTTFFHAFAGTKEFSVSTELFRNGTYYVNKEEAFHDIKLLGDRGPNTQASASYYDPKTQVLFYTQMNRDGVGCWNRNKPYTPETNPLIFQDSEQMEFVNDVKVDTEGTLWILSDKMPKFLYKSLNPDEVNFRIFSIKTEDATAGTACA